MKKGAPKNSNSNQNSRHSFTLSIKQFPEGYIPKGPLSPIPEVTTPKDTLMRVRSTSDPAQQLNASSSPNVDVSQVTPSKSPTSESLHQSETSTSMSTTEIQDKKTYRPC